MRNRQSAIGSRRSRGAFTLVEILVAVGVLAILGVALLGLMSAAVDAWRRGEASRQVNEKLQALRRQIADDLTAAVVDQAPVPDFHYALDTLLGLPGDHDDPYYIVHPDTDAGALKTDTAAGRELTYFAPSGSSATVVLRVRVPFTVQAALLKARMDVFDRNADVRLQVGRNNPSAEDPEACVGWTDVEWLNEARENDGGIGGAERGISAAVRGGDIVFVRAVLRNDVAETAQFLRADALRAEGRPVLILDCYKDPDALPQRARPTFRAYFESGAQVVAFARTIPGETEKAALRDAGSGGGTEYYNYFDDDDDNKVDEPEDLKPLGGRGQVVYRVRPDPDRPGQGILQRAFEAPIGRPVQQLVEEKRLHDFMPGVLYVGMTFWGAETTTWELRPELDPAYDTRDPEPRPPSRRWLSSRYLPEQVQVTVVLEPDRGKRTATELIEAVAADFPATGTGRLRVQNTKGFYAVDRSADFTREFLRDSRHYVKVGDEWIYYEHVADETTFVIPQHGRGARGTTAVAHQDGEEVLRGTTYVFTVSIPAFRHWER